MQELPSLAGEEGWAGRLRAHGAQAGVPSLGDAGMFDADRYRALLSFDASVLPAGGRVEKVVLRVRRAALSGRIDAVQVDLRRGGFGARVEPEVGDHGATATLPGLARFSPPTKDGEWVEVDLGPAAARALDRHGRTQLRLRALGPASFAPNRLELAEARLLVHYLP
jgi:hypothetical protein